MKILLIIPIILVIDLIRSALTIAWLQHNFYKHYRTQKDLYELGGGKEIHVALLGDSGIDGPPINKLRFGPGQTLVEQISKKRKVIAHVFAKEGSRSYDVILKQLPNVKKLNQVDMIIVYMGANNLIRLKSSRRVYKDFVMLIKYAESKNIPVFATEVAAYYHLNMFSWVQRLFIYFLIKDCNQKLRKLEAEFNNFVLADMSWVTKKYATKNFMADKLHPNDVLIRLWADKLYEAAIQKPETKRLLTGIIAE